MAAPDLRGKRFGRLVVMDQLPGTKPLKWRCKCDCGQFATPRASGLRNGTSSSCGCSRLGRFMRSPRDGGPIPLKDRYEYSCFRAMLSRCYCTKHKHYRNYGGRGIVVCDEWRTNYAQFYADMGPAPSRLHSIDRVDNDKNYCKENCRWATRLQQRHNRRPNKTLDELTTEGFMS